MKGCVRQQNSMSKQEASAESNKTDLRDVEQDLRRAGIVCVGLSTGLGEGAV